MNPRSEQEHLGWRVHRAVLEFRAAAQRYGVSYPRLFLHLLRLARRHGFSPREAHREGLSNPRLTEEHLSGSDPEGDLLRLQGRLNPADLIGLTEDKAIYYAFCLIRAHPSPLTRGVRSVSIAILSTRWHLWPV